MECRLKCSRLISIMLARLRMTVDECIREYETLGDVVFGHSRVSLNGLLRPKYSSRSFEELIQSVGEAHTIHPFDLNYHTDKFDDDLCKWFVSPYIRVQEATDKQSIVWS